MEEKLPSWLTNQKLKDDLRQLIVGKLEPGEEIVGFAIQDEEAKPGRSMWSDRISIGKKLWRTSWWAYLLLMLCFVLFFVPKALRDWQTFMLDLHYDPHTFTVNDACGILVTWIAIWIMYKLKLFRKWLPVPDAMPLLFTKRRIAFLHGGKPHTLVEFNRVDSVTRGPGWLKIACKSERPAKPEGTLMVVETNAEEITAKSTIDEIEKIQRIYH